MKYKYRRYYLYYLGRVAFFVFSVIPLRVGIHIGKALGGLAYLLLPHYRRIAVENLRAAFGKDKSEPEIRCIARGVFENLGKNAVEFVHFPEINKANVSDYVTIQNKDVLDRAIASGKGVLLVTAHFGNWELLAAALRLYGYPGVAVGRRIYFYKYDDLLNKLRKVQDVHIVYRDDSPRKMLKVLKQNAIVGIVADQDVDSVEGVFVDFFNRKAYTPSGPAALAKATGAPLIPAVIVRKGLRHELIVDRPIEMMESGDKEADLVENTRRWQSVIESYIRLYPEQWVWMHRRWKTRPIDSTNK